MTCIRILLADDHALVRAGIRALLQQIPGFEVVAEADDGNAAVELVEKFQPDIALMDIAMPGLTGLQATARITKSFSNVRVIMLSMHAEQEYVLQALRAGAVGYLLKGARTSELELAITAAMRGETYLSPAASKQLVGDMLARRSDEPSSGAHLTPRQRQVLQLIAEGCPRKQIAQKIGVSAKTVDTYRAQIMQQLNIHDTVGLVRYAMKVGLIETEPRGSS